MAERLTTNQWHQEAAGSTPAKVIFCAVRLCGHDSRPGQHNFLAAESHHLVAWCHHLESEVQNGVVCELARAGMSIDIHHSLVRAAIPRAHLESASTSTPLLRGFSLDFLPFWSSRKPFSLMEIVEAWVEPVAGSESSSSEVGSVGQIVLSSVQGNQRKTVFPLKPSLRHNGQLLV